MIVRTMMLIAAVMMHQLHASKRTDVTNEKYEYVVALVKDYRRCTGTLISPNWVLTAADCLDAATHIQYGNMTIPFSESETNRKVMFSERPPASKILEPDLGMIYVDSVPMNQYGQLSAVDYTAMVGHVIEYAGFGFTKKDYTKVNEGELQKYQDQVRPLQVRGGAVSLCTEDEKSAFAPYLCVAPMCSDGAQQTPPGEPGSPLFHAGKLAGVHVGAALSSIRSYTPVSPYLSWIQRLMNREEKISRSNANTFIPTENEYRRFQDLTQYLQGLKDRLTSYKDEVMSPLLQENYQKHDAENTRKS